VSDESLICDVCQLRTAKGVASMPGVPVSCAYCQVCLDANAHPYWAVVANTVAIDGLGNAAPWWRQLVDDTLGHLGINRETFETDVLRELAEREVLLQREDREA
jgi:hypothetical protein